MWIVVGFKLAIVALTTWAAGLDSDTTVMVSTTTWPWLIIPLLAIVAPLTYQYRLRWVRSRREGLIRPEGISDVEERIPDVSALGRLPSHGD